MSAQKWDRFSKGEEVIYTDNETHDTQGYRAIDLDKGKMYVVCDTIESTPFFFCPVCRSGPQGIRVFGGYYASPSMWHCATQFRKPEVDEDKEETKIGERRLIDA